MLNRNDICACGSGKKYKKCCLLKDLSEKKEDKPKEEKKSKTGTMSMRSGHIFTYDEDEKETEIDISYVKADMRDAITATERNSIYVQYVKSWILELTNAGLRAIPGIQSKLYALLGKEKPKGITIGGGGKNVPMDHRTRLVSNGDKSFLSSKFAISVGKPSKNKHNGKHIGLGTELTARQCFSTWENQLGMIKNFASSKPKAKDDSNKLYADNFEKAFKEPELEQKVA